MSPPMRQLLKEILSLRNQNKEPVVGCKPGWHGHLFNVQVPGWGSWHKYNCSREALPLPYLVWAFWGVSKHFLLGSSEVWVCKVKTEGTEFQIKETGSHCRLLLRARQPPVHQTPTPTSGDAAASTWAGTSPPELHLSLSLSLSVYWSGRRRYIIF